MQGKIPPGIVGVSEGEGRWYLVVFDRILTKGWTGGLICNWAWVGLGLVDWIGLGVS